MVEVSGLNTQQFSLLLKENLSNEVKAATSSRRRLQSFNQRSQSARIASGARPLVPADCLKEPRTHDWAVLAGSRRSLPTNMRGALPQDINVNMLRASDNPAFFSAALVTGWEDIRAAPARSASACSMRTAPRSGLHGHHRFPTEYTSYYTPDNVAYRTRLESIYGLTLRATQRGTLGATSALGSTGGTSANAKSPSSLAAAIASGRLFGAATVAAAAAANGYACSPADGNTALTIGADTQANASIRGSTDASVTQGCRSCELSGETLTVADRKWARTTTPSPSETISQTSHNNSPSKLEFQQLDAVTSARARILLGSHVATLASTRATAALQASQTRHRPQSVHRRDFKDFSSQSRELGLLGFDAATMTSRRPMSALPLTATV